MNDADRIPSCVATSRAGDASELVEVDDVIVSQKLGGAFLGFHRSKLCCMNSFLIQSRRHYSAHNALLRAADNYVHAAEQNQPFCSDGDFVSLVMSSLALESLCNTTGELIVPDWKDFESASPWAKIRILSERLGVAFDRNVEPFQSLLWVIRFRNKIAHAKPEALTEEVIVAPEEYQSLLSGEGPRSGLEKQISIDTAKRALKAIVSAGGSTYFPA